jgi:hypothetical protein
MAARKQFKIPRTWPDQPTADGFSAHVEAVLRAQAIEQGEILVGDPVLIGRPEDGGITATDDGPVETIIVTYEAPTSKGASIETATVQGEEVEPGVWHAYTPAGVLIVNVKHGLDTLDVQASASGGFRSFVPIDRDEVSVVCSPTTRSIRIERVPDTDETTNPQPVATPPQRAGA